MVVSAENPCPRMCGGGIVTRQERKALARREVNQSNIDRVTAELGRQPGDLGEKRRLEVLTQKRRDHVALENAKVRSKKAEPRNP
jgi:hypothetical protein